MSRRNAFPLFIPCSLCRLQAAILSLLFFAAFVCAQDTPVVPRVVQFAGSAVNAHPGKTEVVFALYKEQSDRIPLWQESQTVFLDDSGRFAVLLGATNADGIPTDVFDAGYPRWVGVTVNGQAEQPRVLLTSVPYALKASDAETLGGLPASAFLRASAGTATSSTSPPAGALASSSTPGESSRAASSKPAAITAAGAKAGYLPVFTDATGDLAPSLIAETSKYVGIGTATPANPLSVAGIIQSTTGGFLFPDSTAQITAVPKCATGQSPLWAGVAWTCVTSSVKLGTGLTGSFSSGLLTLNTSASTSATLGKGLTGGISNNALTLNTDTSYLQQRVTGTCSGGSAIASIAQAGTVTCQAVSGGSGGITLPVNWSGAAVAPAGVLNVTDTTAGPASSKNSTPNFAALPSAIVATSTGSGTTAAITGQATSTSSNALGVGVLGLATGGQGIGVMGYSTYTGDMPVVTAWSAATSGVPAGFDAELYSPAATGYRVNFNVAPTSGWMIQANVNTNNGPHFSVDGGANINTSGGLSVNGVTTLYGGASINGPFNVTGSSTLNGLTVNGSLNVTGNLSKSSGTFRIDHPLDPANKYLSHSFVESPDMMNIYNGNVVTDAHGFATISLPAYFEALNQDFRYQLTVIGQFAQAIIAQEIANNQFTIQTNKPAVKVSWQVTGIRHDAYAEVHRVVVEEDKPASERGTYLHPELFNNPPQSKDK